MDSLTQIVIGIATVEVIAGRTLKNRSFLYGAILGTLPDLDVWLGRFFAYEMELAFHRGFTHSFLGWIILSPLLAGIIRLWNKELSFNKWTFIVFCTFLTHTGIDLFTAWGVQLLYPLPNRFAFQSIAVVDPLYTLPWLISLLLIFRTQDFGKRRLRLRWTFLLTSCYLLYGLIVQQSILHKVKKELPAQLYSDYVVKPTMGNSLLWSIHAKSEDHYLIGFYCWTNPKTIDWTRYSFDTKTQTRWEHYPSIETLKDVSEGWYIIEEVDANHALFNDLRFGVLEREGQQQFVFSYALIKKGEDIVVEPLPKNLQDGRKALQRIWQRITEK